MDIFMKSKRASQIMENWKGVMRSLVSFETGRLLDCVQARQWPSECMANLSIRERFDALILRLITRKIAQLRIITQYYALADLNALLRVSSFA